MNTGQMRANFYVNLGVTCQSEVSGIRKNLMPAWAEKGQTQNQNSQLCHWAESIVTVLQRPASSPWRRSRDTIWWTSYLNILWIHELPQPKDTLFLRRQIKSKLHIQEHAHTNWQPDNQSATQSSKCSRMTADTAMVFFQVFVSLGGNDWALKRD